MASSKPDENAVTIVQSSPMQLMEMALQQLGGEHALQAVEALDKLVALHNQQEDRQAKRDFNAAMAKFQRACPRVIKKHKAEIRTKTGGAFSIPYADLDDILTEIKEPLAKNGLSITWDTEMPEKGVIRAVCTIGHSSGHAITSTFSAPVPMDMVVNDAQKYGAARTYAMRYALLQGLGLSAGDPDTDGNYPQGGNGKGKSERVADSIQRQKDTKVDPDASVGQKMNTLMQNDRDRLVRILTAELMKMYENETKRCDEFIIKAVQDGSLKTEDLSANSKADLCRAIIQVWDQQKEGLRKVG